MTNCKRPATSAKFRAGLNSASLIGSSNVAVVSAAFAPRQLAGQRAQMQWSVPAQVAAPGRTLGFAPAKNDRPGFQLSRC